MSISIAMIMLGPEASISPEAVETALAELRNDSPKPRWSEEDGNGTVFFLEVGAQQVIVGRMPAPIPWSDLEGPCATSVLWEDAAEKVQGHVEHLIVTVMDDGELMERLRLLTQAVAAILKSCSQSIGVYWGNACLVIQPELFIAFATDLLPLGPPLHIWVDCRIGRGESGRTEGFTCGMAALGHMEFETQTATDSPGDLRERFYALARYLLENGPVIKDGDTIGEDEIERIRVVYADSAFGTEGKVMRLEYSSLAPKKPWWKVW